MKFFVFLSCVLFFGFTPEIGFSQRVDISSDMNLSLDEVFQLIKNQTEYVFLYPSDLFVHIPRVHLKKGKIEVSKLLKKSLSPVDLSFKFMDDKVIVIERVNLEEDNKNIINTSQNVLKGTVVDGENGIGLNEVKLVIIELGIETYTNEKGIFEFSNIPISQFTLFVERDEYKFEQINVNDISKPLSILLMKNSVELKEVVVIGKQGSKEGSTSTVIKRAAIEHIQATSLDEVLQLMPGGLVNNPDFSNTKQASIRQYEPDNLNSLGTAIIINGATISNNANLQVTSSARSGFSANFSTSSGGGVDLRSITADNIESVEIIRGIPSVEYGDLNSGAMIIKTKAYKEPLQIKARFNPKLNQFWAGKGFNLPNKKGSVFADLDYTQTFDNENNKYRKYRRITGQLQHTYISNISNWKSNSTFAFGYTNDTYELDPDFVIDSLVTKSSDSYLRFVNNGSFDFDSRFSRKLNYTFSANYNKQKGYQQRYYNADITAESNALYDSTNEVPYLPSAYMSKMWVDGAPLNFGAKLSNSFYLLTGEFNHNFLMGAEWKFDANFGDGKTFTRPPTNISGAAYRQRPYKDIPALNQLGFYVQDKFSGYIKNNKINVIAGLRYDIIQPFNDEYSLNALSPRINASFDTEFGLTFRGGFGITAKSPTLMYLYPENAYFDFFSLNHYTSNPSERLAIISTRVFNTENHELKLSKTNKSEVGLDWSLKGNRFSITGYYETTKNGYNLSTGINSVKFASYPIYKVADRPQGQPPVLSDDVESRTRFVSYNSPSNNINRINKGIEFDFDFNELQTINTTFNVNGAYAYTHSLANRDYILQQNLAGRETTRVGVFNGRGNENQRFVTTVRAITHIPEVGFVVTLSAQTIWMDSHRYIGYESLPIGYIPYNTESNNHGVIYFTEAERQNIDPIVDADIYLNINDIYFIEEKWAPLWLFNLKLTKQFKGGLNFSFFANNFINHRPLQSSTRTPSSFMKRNIAFFFGSEISIKL